jgi:hypothetical protein
MEKYRHLWEQAGGIFVHHRSAAESVEALRDYFDLKETAPTS